MWPGNTPSKSPVLEVPDGSNIQDRGSRRGRLVLGAFGHNERVTLAQDDRALPAVRLADGDIELAVEHEEELVGIHVRVPNVLTHRVRDTDVVVVHPRTAVIG
jgi:hypothetical protein